MKVDQEKLNNYIKKLQPHPCPLCHKGQWIVTDTVFYLNEYHENGIFFGGPSYPVIPLVCSECGNTIFINAIVSGLVNNTNPQNPPSKEDK